jgi:hypothetical protein
MIITKGGQEIADVDLSALTVETEDPVFEEMFYQLADEGIPSMSGGEKDGTLFDEEEHIAVSSESEGMFLSFILDYGYEPQKETKTRDAGMVEVSGFPIVIEHHAGEERYGKRLPVDYGYIRRTGSAEGQDIQMDCFVRGEEGDIFVIDSYIPEIGTFDEHKIMIGYANKAAAVKDFSEYYSGGIGESGPLWQMKAPDRRLGYATLVTAGGLRAWLDAGNLTRPYYTPSNVQYTPNADPAEHRCENCEYFKDGICSSHVTHHDPKVPQSVDGAKIVVPSGWCNQYKVDFHGMAGE